MTSGHPGIYTTLTDVTKLPQATERRHFAKEANHC